MKVVLGVTGCIAAYKSALILRGLQEAGCNVFPVMTSSALQFLTPLTLEKLSGNPVVSGLFEDTTLEIEHISLARRSDLLLVAPATANILAKFASGIADDFLTTLYLSTTTPVIVAPAMNVEMWRHPATQGNLETLRRRGVRVVEPGTGFLACGESGEGRLADPETITGAVLGTLRRKKGLKGRRVLVTAGPTVEDIDPVRYLSNRSSGKMGYALAGEAWMRGADVTLVSGPTCLEPPNGVQRLSVRSAEEMSGLVLELYPQVDIVIMAAAVSDFRPQSPAARKVKKDGVDLELQLVRTTDILAELGRRKKHQLLVGFAAESEDLHENARRKLDGKNLDLVVANDISTVDGGFGSDSNRVLIIDREGGEIQTELLLKTEVAGVIWDRVEQERVTRPEA